MIGRIDIYDENPDPRATGAIVPLAILCQKLESKFGKLALLDALITLYLNNALEYKNADTVKEMLRALAATEVDKIDQQRRAMQASPGGGSA
jgi:hypothetical protein